MSNRKMISRFAAAAALLPSTAFAQAVVTTTPATVPAPALSPALLLVLSIVLACAAFGLLRRAPKGAVAAFALAAFTTIAAGIGFATPTDIIVDGGDCNMTTEFEYNPDYGPRDLVNDCTNDLRIIVLDVVCDDDEIVSGEIPPSPVPWCSLNQVLAAGTRCELPDCTYQ